MKLLLISLLISVSCSAQTFNSAQVDTLFFRSWIDVPNVSIRSDGKINIQGDTIVSIKHLLDLVQKLSDEKEEMRAAINAGASFTNTIPDYLKKSWAYDVWVSKLKKQGYKTIRK